jgi:hypothetical protein
MDTNEVLSDIKKYRKSRKETQSTFWNRFGLTQPGGSRYEGDQKIPLPTAILVGLFADGLISESDIDEIMEKVKKCDRVSS